MGSFFAGIKAGTLAGILYIGGLGASLVAVLYFYKADAITSLLQSYSQFCVSVAPSNSTSIGSGQDCFDQVIQNVIPAGAMLGFFISLAYGGVMGMYFEIMPGKSRLLKGQPIAIASGFTILILGLQPLFALFSFEFQLYALLVFWTLVFGLMLSTLYKRYTRTVEIQSQDPTLLRMIVDGRDFTGKARTFALTSSHKIRAEAAEDASFQEWEPSGGITLEDQRSFETVMEVNGDGTLKGKVGRKY